MKFPPIGSVFVSLGFFISFICLFAVSPNNSSAVVFSVAWQIFVSAHWGG